MPPNPLQGGITLRLRKDEKVIGRFLPLATSDQLSLIENLKKEAGWDDEHLKNYIRKQHKVGSIQESDIKRAGNVIDVLKREKQKRMNEATHVLT